jgi:hypothetical protein
MKTRHHLILGLIAILGLATLLSFKTAPTERTAPTEKIGLDALDGFVGTWVMANEKGEPTDQVMLVVRSTAGGSVLMETMMPGTPNEMVTMYYTTDGELMMTHYCGCTNHPILKASRADDGALRFDCVGPGENFAVCATTTHMHEAVYRLDGDKFDSTWRMLDNGVYTQASDFHHVRAKPPVDQAKVKTKSAR